MKVLTMVDVKYSFICPMIELFVENRWEEIANWQNINSQLATANSRLAHEWLVVLLNSYRNLLYFVFL